MEIFFFFLVCLCFAILYSYPIYIIERKLDSIETILYDIFATLEDVEYEPTSPADSGTPEK